MGTSIKRLLWAMILGAAASQVYYDDMGQVGESSPKEQIARKAEVLRTLLKRSRERSISIHWIH